MERSSCFVTARPKAAASVRLFCFPHAGGGPTAFTDLPKRLGAGIECVFLQYPGRGQRLREQPHVGVESLVEEIYEAFGRWKDKPFAFYGHSLGGIVAFDLARRLLQSGSPGPAHLFVGASRPPHLGLPLPPIHRLPDREFIQAVQARYGGIPAAVTAEPELLELFLPALRADFTAYETYRCASVDRLEIPISAFGGIEDRVITLAMMRGWERHTSSAFHITALPGGHFFTGNSADRLAHELRASLVEYLRDRTPA